MFEKLEFIAKRLFNKHLSQKEIEEAKIGFKQAIPTEFNSGYVENDEIILEHLTEEFFKKGKGLFKSADIPCDGWYPVFKSILVYTLDGQLKSSKTSVGNPILYSETKSHIKEYNPPGSWKPIRNVKNKSAKKVYNN